MHGGLRYLATGNVGIARRSAVERGILMTRNAPHLVTPCRSWCRCCRRWARANRALVRTGFLAGDALRALAGTPSSTLPRSRRVAAERAVELAPTVRRDGLDGGLLAYDGQLIDDAATGRRRRPHRRPARRADPDPRRRPRMSPATRCG